MIVKEYKKYSKEIKKLLKNKDHHFLGEYTLYWDGKEKNIVQIYFGNKEFKKFFMNSPIKKERVSKIKTVGIDELK